jgi:hypothetical protein
VIKQMRTSIHIILGSIASIRTGKARSVTAAQKPAGGDKTPRRHPYKSLRLGLQKLVPKPFSEASALP